MPELPEVETVVRRFRPLVVGRRITRFVTRWARNALPDSASVRGAIVGRRIERLWRRSKWIVFDLDSGAHLLIHLRMSGRLASSTETNGDRRHVRAWWDLDDGSRLWFCDARKFGRIALARHRTDFESTLGVEPLDRRFTVAVLRDLLRRRARQLKPLLLDQSVIAGLGNIYVDESLFAAGVHPATRSDRLAPGQVRALHASIRRVLREAIRREGTSFDWIYPGGRMQAALSVYGRAGQPCRRCGTTIVAIRIAQRGTHVCPRCQPIANPQAPGGVPPASTPRPR